MSHEVNVKLEGQNVAFYQGETHSRNEANFKL